MATLTIQQREDFFLGMNEADLVAFVVHIKTHFEVAFDTGVAEVERIRTEDEAAGR